MFIGCVESVLGPQPVTWSEHNGACMLHDIHLCTPEEYTAKLQALSRLKQQQHPDLDRFAPLLQTREQKAKQVPCADTEDAHTHLLNWALDHCDFSGTTAWQQAIWRCLATEVPSGNVISYGALAAKLGRPGAARSVGSCMAKNRFPILIPCHRVVTSSASLGGFMNGSANGLYLKRQLLAAEGVHYTGNTLKTPEAFLA